MKKYLYFFVACIFLFAGNVSPLFCSAQRNEPSAFPDRIVLTLTENPGASFVATWRSDTTIHAAWCEYQEATSTRINITNSHSSLAKTTTVSYDDGTGGNIVVNQHSCIIMGLTPGKKYLYRVGKANFWSEWFQVQMPRTDTNNFSFIYFGDPQVDLRSQWSRVIRRAYQQSPDCAFMLYGGDIINRAGRDDEYQQLFDAGSYIFAMVPQIMTPGNHDYKDKVVDPHWNSQFHFPQNGPAGLKGTCYFVDYQNLKLISIDSASGDELEDENGYEMTVQKAWLDSVLRTNTKKWIVLSTHLPFYSTKDTRDNPNLRKNFQPILEKYGVDLVLTGHDHAYGRGRASDNPNVKPSVVYVVSVSGPKIYEAGTKSWMQKKGSNLQLFQAIQIRSKTLEYKSFTADGILFDSFRITRSESGRKKFISSDSK